ncbi:fatty acid desaturase [Ovoidimarina sediminis]|uniref:fatty acid desaturase n=1 Tax=Ovoidimarina sediminis TaxID=3079856 RepID=UPI002915A193|nr:fatty acid desaturase [Rhodophyticola sp. MJ-SS7]MDU8943227.1 fatty acid desaturase [Rhodophyticola sp. MJ-SS7]
MGEALDHKGFLAAVPAETREELTARDDAPALRHLLRHAGLILVFQVYVAFGLPLWWVMPLPLGVALAFLFTLQHECTHKTPFETGWINETVGHVTGFLIFQPFEWFRAFHMAHHRFTNDPERDPELEVPKPEGRGPFLWYLVGLRYWRAKIIVLLANAGGGDDVDYLTDRIRPRIKREARLMLLGYALLAVTLFWSSLIFWVWLLPLILGFPVLRLYLLAEHGRCPAVADMFENTRTTLTTTAVRFLAWNMPYHAEHHAWPAVPFHRLPEVHALAERHLKRVSPGYGAFLREYVSEDLASRG